jgi:hypothetical protein
LEDLAKATGKSVEKILLCICKQATEQRQEALEALEQGVPQLERCLLDDGTPLIHEYHSKVLGRLAKLLNLNGQAQAARLGLNVVQPALAYWRAVAGRGYGTVVLILRTAPERLCFRRRVTLYRPMIPTIQ